MNSSQRTLEMRNELPQSVRVPTVPNDPDTESEFRWQLYTLAGSAATYFAFFVLLTMAFSEPFYSGISVAPLALYDVVKGVFSGLRLRKDWDVEGKDDLKDLIECIFMILYKVNAAPD